MDAEHELKAVLFGAGGQLGSEISAQISDWELVSAPRSIDISDHEQVNAFISEVRPAWIINAAAMTNVDLAHDLPERALAVNALGPANIARSAKAVGARVIQISTEAVFDGERVSSYVETDACNPVSVYGVAKLAGDHFVQIYSPESFVLRTSWLYSGAVGMNFPTRLIEQLNDPDRAISVVTDVVGNPTTTKVLTEAILAVMQAPPEPGVYHVCCLGSASKYEWALAIAESAGHDAGRIQPVTSDQYPTVALRPKHVDLDCTKFLNTKLYALPTWQQAWNGART